MDFKIGTTFFIFGFIVITLFGFLSLAAIDHSIGHLCPVALLQSGNCPPVTLSLINHHFFGFQRLTQTIINNSYVTQLLFMGSVLLIFSLYKKLQFNHELTLQSILLYIQEWLEINFSKIFLAWFILQRNRDSNTNILLAHYPFN